jgi:hypothetical protein
MCIIWKQKNEEIHFLQEKLQKIDDSRFNIFIAR